MVRSLCPRPLSFLVLALGTPSAALAESERDVEIVVDGAALAGIEIRGAVDAGEVVLIAEPEVGGEAEAAGAEAGEKAGADGEGGDGASAAEKAKEESEALFKSLPAGQQILALLDYDPTVDSYSDRLDELLLDAEGLAAVRGWIEDLDSDDFRARNEASKRLAMRGSALGHLLGEARAEAGVEMGRRIQDILNVRVKGRRVDALFHAAEKIAAEAGSGFAERLLTTGSSFSPEHYWDLLRVMELALAKTSDDQAEGLLRAALAGDSPAAAEMAAFALGYRAPDSGDGRSDRGGEGELAELARSRGRVAAGDPEAAGALVGLLGADSLRVRHEAGALLRAMFGEDFGFAAYDTGARRAEAAGRWENYLAGGEKIAIPAVLGAAGRGEYRVLVGQRPGKGQAVAAFNTSGHAQGDHPLAAAIGEIRPDRIVFDEAAGLVVVSAGDDEGGQVAVFASNGAEIWRVSGLPAGGGCAPAEGGRLLMAIGQEVEALSVTGDRVGVWKLGEEVVSFGRLRPGRYLCAHPGSGRVAEYDGDGQLLWERDGLERPSWVERIPNGNLLVVVVAEEEKGGGGNNGGLGEVELSALELLELSPDGGEVLARIRPKGVSEITCAARLPNGNTLVGTEKGLAEYTPEGYAVKVWVKSVISSLHVR